MSVTMTPAVLAALTSQKESFLNAYDREHATTMRVLRAFPAAQMELRPHAKCKSARELAFVFAAERGLGKLLMQNAFANGMPAGGPPPIPADWDGVLTAVEMAHQEFGAMIRDMPDEQLMETVKFFVAPMVMGDMSRLEVLWMLLHDEIHHRGQFSVYLRMADGKVPSIYGPTADEPWM
jgi:uncharacterized damage-inducible protein DinB